MRVAYDARPQQLVRKKRAHALQALARNAVVRKRKRWKKVRIKSDLTTLANYFIVSLPLVVEHKLNMPPRLLR